MEKWQNKLHTILKSVGVKNAENVKLIETESFGPTTVGCDLPFSKTKAIVFVPRALLLASEEELSEEQRRDILEADGTLFPTEKEMDYILGHEAAHLAKNHSLKSSAVGLTSLGLSLGFLNSVSGATRQITSSVVIRRSLFSIAVSAMAVGAVSILQEREADLTSASKLNCVHEASLLVEKKRKQNLWVREQAGGSLLRSFVSARGNDLLEWEHPSVTWQLSYLEKLERQSQSSTSA